VLFRSQLAPPGEPEDHAVVFLPPRLGGGEDKAPRHAQVDQYMPAARQVDHDELPAPTAGGDCSSREARAEFIRRRLGDAAAPQDIDRTDARAGDARAEQLIDDGLDFGKLGHGRRDDNPCGGAPQGAVARGKRRCEN